MTNEKKTKLEEEDSWEIKEMMKDNFESMRNKGLNVTQMHKTARQASRGRIAMDRTVFLPQILKRKRLLI